MAGPWEDFQESDSKESGPWDDYKKSDSKLLDILKTPSDVAGNLVGTMGGGLAGGLSYLANRAFGADHEQAKASMDDTAANIANTIKGSQSLYAKKAGEFGMQAMESAKTGLSGLMKGFAEAEARREEQRLAINKAGMPSDTDTLRAIKDEVPITQRIAPEAADSAAEAALNVLPVHLLGRFAKDVATPMPKAPVPKVVAPEPIVPTRPPGPQAPQNFTTMGGVDIPSTNAALTPLERPVRPSEPPRPADPTNLDYELSLVPKDGELNTVKPDMETIPFPDRIESFNQDPRVLSAQRSVRQLKDPEKIEAKREEIITLAKDEYGIDEGTATQKLYESGGDTQAPIVKGFAGRKQGGGIDPNLLGIPQLAKLIDRFKNREATPEVTPEAQAVGDTMGDIPGFSRAELNKPLDDINTVKSNVEAGERDISPQRGQEFGSGLRNAAVRTGNSVLRYTNTMLERGRAAGQAASDHYLLGENGVNTTWARLKSDEQIPAFKKLIEEDKLNKRFTDEELSKSGLSSNQIDWLKSAREANDAKWNMGGKGERLIGYLEHTLNGDYKSYVFDTKTKEPLAVLNTNSKWEQNTARAWAEGYFKNRDVTITKTTRDPVRHTGSWNRSKLTMDDVLDVLKSGEEFNEKTLAKILEAKDATSTRDLFNASVHDKNRKASPVLGWDGNKPWLSDKQNMREGIKSYLDTSHTQFMHHAYQEPIKAVKAMLRDESIDMPNAKASAEKYLDQVTGQTNPWATGRAFNNLADGVSRTLGFGGSAPARFSGAVRDYTHMWQLGTNIKNFIVQLTQPITSGVPNLLLARTLNEMSPKELITGTSTGFARWVQKAVAPDRMDQFTKDMSVYAAENGMAKNVVTENMLDATRTRVGRAVNKYGTALGRIAENNTREPMFYMFASLLKEKWDRDPTAFKSQAEMFETAKNHTQQAMIDYNQGPTGYRQISGVGGGLLGQFRTYSHGTIGNLRNMYKYDKVAFASSMGMLTYLTGVEGLAFYQDVNNLIKQITPMFTNGRTKDIKDLITENMDTSVKLFNIDQRDWFKGGASGRLGFDISPQFSTQPFLPDFDVTKDVPTNIGKAFSGIPASSLAKPIIEAVTGHGKAAIHDAIPSGQRGIYENQALTKPNGLYMDAKTGKGIYRRSEEEQNLRSMGLTSNKEVDERAQVFKDSQQEHRTKERQKSAVSDLVATTRLNGVKPGDIQEAWQKYSNGTPTKTADPATFVQAYVNGLKEAMQTNKERGQKIPSGTITSINKWLEYNHQQRTQQ